MSNRSYDNNLCTCSTYFTQSTCATQLPTPPPPLQIACEPNSTALSAKGLLTKTGTNNTVYIGLLTSQDEVHNMPKEGGRGAQKTNYQHEPREDKGVSCMNV